MAKKNFEKYSVSRLTSLIKATLETHLPARLIVSGEVTGLKAHSSGHCYFSLKDAGAILPCVMWKSRFSTLKFQPENGMAVLATGHVDVYEPGGKYQFYADKLEPEGTGALQIAFEQMVRRLRAEGLFDEGHKKQIPRFPMRIGVITSASGAALQDIRDSIHNRWPCCRLLFRPVPVQGEGAAGKIATAIQELNAHNAKLRLDVLIVGRGGGSMEDLWAFNEEPVARAIYNSVIPVISAVGHEVDVTIADLVADARASTPTKAGVIAVPDMDEVLAGLEQMRRRLELHTSNSLLRAEHRLGRLSAAALFRTPKAVLHTPIQRADELESRLAGSMRSRLVRFSRFIEHSRGRIQTIEPHRLLGQRRRQLEDLAHLGRIKIQAILSKKQLQFTAMEHRLVSLNPRAVLQRGYSLTTNPITGKVITSADMVAEGDRILTELAQGHIESEVKKTM